MKISKHWSTIVPVAISIIALVVSYHANNLVKTVATSDFQASERVKTDIAGLVATLDSVMTKGALIRAESTDQRFYDISPERKKIEAFLLSPTAIAFRSLVADKSEAAGEGKPENWRTFFIRLTKLLYLEGYPYGDTIEAAKIQLLLADLSRDDIEGIAKNLNDIPGQLAALLSNRQRDVLIGAVMKLAQEDSNGEDQDFELFIEFLSEVKSIKDPDVELFWLVISGDNNPELYRGADKSVTDKEIWRRYDSHVAEFQQWRDERE